MSYYGQDNQQQQRQQFNFDDAYGYLQQQMQRYRNTGDFIPQELRPTDNRLLTDLDGFTEFAIRELPHFWSTTNKRKLVAVVEATMQDRNLGQTGCALSVFIAGAYRLRCEKRLSDHNAFEEGILLYGAWFAVKNRWRLEMDRQAESEFRDQADYFGSLISNNRSQGNRNRDYDGNAGGGFNANQARQDANRGNGRSYEDQVARMNQGNQPAYQPPADIAQRNNMQTAQPAAQPQAPAQSAAAPQQTVLLNSSTWTNKKHPHPPAWYGKVAAAMIDQEGNVSLTPASLALPPDTPAILRLGDIGNFGEGPSYDTSALLTQTAFTDKIIAVPVPLNAYTNPAEYIKASCSRPGNVVVSVRAKRWEICGDREATVQPLKRIAEFFHKGDTRITDLAAYLKHVRTAKNEADIYLPDLYYWNINNTCSEMFRVMSELMMGIDPYVLRLGCFGPTGKPEDDNDVEQYLTYLQSTMGNTYADLMQSTKFASIFAEMVFPRHVEVNRAVKHELTEMGEDYFTAAYGVERYAYVDNISYLNDLRMIKWRSVGHQESPYGYAPSRIEKSVCPALYDLASGVLATHDSVGVPMAVLNFGYGKLIVTKSFIGGGIVGKWVTFVN